LIYGPQEEGALWTVSSVEFFLFGLIFLALGLIGEYVGRIYLEVRRRPTYIVRKVHGADAATSDTRSDSKSDNSKAD
jgi:undecaprenyl-phosphate 4-deoxy-4-formamido-L-arabinose transferase